MLIFDGNILRCVILCWDSLQYSYDDCITYSGIVCVIAATAAASGALLSTKVE